jgi:hypothetical protein
MQNNNKNSPVSRVGVKATTCRSAGRYIELVGLKMRGGGGGGGGENETSYTFSGTEYKNLECKNAAKICLNRGFDQFR